MSNLSGKDLMTILDIFEISLKAMYSKELDSVVLCFRAGGRVLCRFGRNSRCRTLTKGSWNRPRWPKIPFKASPSSFSPISESTSHFKPN